MLLSYDGFILKIRDFTKCWVEAPNSDWSHYSVQTLIFFWPCCHHSSGRRVFKCCTWIHMFIFGLMSIKALALGLGSFEELDFGEQQDCWLPIYYKLNNKSVFLNWLLFCFWKAVWFFWFVCFFKALVWNLHNVVC